MLGRFPSVRNASWRSHGSATAASTAGLERVHRPRCAPPPVTTSSRPASLTPRWITPSLFPVSGLNSSVSSPLAYPCFHCILKEFIHSVLFINLGAPKNITFYSIKPSRKPPNLPLLFPTANHYALFLFFFRLNIKVL